jgi:SPP1 gp7 family putative phage head morphogenesis protein
MPVGVAIRYQAEILELIHEAAAETEMELRALFREPEMKDSIGVAQDKSPAVQARILTNALIKKLLARFAKKAKTSAERFAARSEKANSVAVKSSIQKLTGQISMPAASLSPGSQEVLEAATAENVSLIKSIGQEYLGKVQQSVLRSMTQGTDITALFKDLKKIKGVSERRAKVIAYDQTAKISSALSRERFQSAGLVCYTWRHTAGSNHPRALHKRLDGKKFRYDTPIKIQDDPVVYGFPGTLINCSCRMQPMLESEV